MSQGEGEDPVVDVDDRLDGKGTGGEKHLLGVVEEEGNGGGVEGKRGLEWNKWRENHYGWDFIFSGEEEGGLLAPNDTAYKRWSCHSGLKLLCKLCRTSPPPAIGARSTVFWACRPCGPAGWLVLTKAGDVETNPGLTTLNKKVWICDICHKQIHVRKQISIRCNRIEHWVHLRCAGIRQAQYTDTWTCHLHRESRLTPHTDITPPHRSRPWAKPPTHSPHHRNQNTDTCPTLPLSL